MVRMKSELDNERVATKKKKDNCTVLLRETEDENRKLTKEYKLMKSEVNSI